MNMWPVLNICLLYVSLNNPDKEWLHILSKKVYHQNKHLVNRWLPFKSGMYVGFEYFSGIFRDNRDF